MPQTKRTKLTQFCTKLEATKRAGRQCSQLDKENVEAKVNNDVKDAILVDLPKPLMMQWLS